MELFCLFSPRRFLLLFLPLLEAIDTYTIFIFFSSGGMNAKNLKRRRKEGLTIDWRLSSRPSAKWKKWEKRKDSFWAAYRGKSLSFNRKLNKNSDKELQLPHVRCASREKIKVTERQVFSNCWYFFGTNKLMKWLSFFLPFKRKDNSESIHFIYLLVNNWKKVHFPEAGNFHRRCTYILCQKIIFVSHWENVKKSHLTSVRECLFSQVFALPQINLCLFLWSHLGRFPFFLPRKSSHHVSENRTDDGRWAKKAEKIWQKPRKEFSDHVWPFGFIARFLDTLQNNKSVRKNQGNLVKFFEKVLRKEKSFFFLFGKAFSPSLYSESFDRWGPPCSEKPQNQQSQSH